MMGVRAGERDYAEQREAVCGVEAKHRLFFFFKFIYLLFLAELGLFCCAGFSVDAPSVGCPLAAMHKLLMAVASLVAEHRL